MWSVFQFVKIIVCKTRDDLLLLTTMPKIVFSCFPHYSCHCVPVWLDSGPRGQQFVRPVTRQVLWKYSTTATLESGLTTYGVHNRHCCHRQWMGRPLQDNRYFWFNFGTIIYIALCAPRVHLFIRSFHFTCHINVVGECQALLMGVSNCN